MAGTLKDRQKFIEMRAENVSFAKIAKELKVSKSTLITWAKAHELDIQNLRAIAYEALNDQYKVGKQHQLEMWSEQLEAVRAELKKRGLGDIPTPKLLELLDTLSEKLKNEAYKVEFKSEAVEKPYEVKEFITTYQDKWQG
ncbi:MAG TPA: helix-turn-helix domain-containing protein [Candidatus Saccharimonadales bacterium]|nr:helix-turn-helix domain-containing protein [Candidatus Saccharimonadales bacterium]